MVKKIVADGYEALKKTISVEDTSKIYVLFTGSKDKNGKSWCPDCVKADPAIEEALKDAPEDIIFITCTVGNREFWKDPNNIFRTDQDLKLKSVPTLIKWKTPKKLEESQLFDKNIVSMMFEDD